MTSSAAGNLSALHDWRYEIDVEDIAWAVFDREGESTNTLGHRATEELAAIVGDVEAKAASGGVRGLVIISAKETNFIAGADIREFENFTTEKEVTDAILQATAILDRIEAMRVPVVAAIHGFCLGGGLELAMACSYRIADREDGTRLGLPEVKLGIFPGLNGVVRSLRLAGPLNAMSTMLTGRMLRPTAARALGLVDQLVPTRHSLRWSARKAVLQKRASKGAGWLKRLMRKWPIRGYLAGQMRKQTAAKVRADHYPAPFALIDLFARYGGDEQQLKREETKAFAPLMVSDQARNLRRVFYLSEQMKALAPKGTFKPLRAHIIGAGTMGADIAAWCVVSGMEVSLQDLSEDQLKAAQKQAKKLFRKRMRARGAYAAALSRFYLDKDGEHVPRADIIIEAIVEKLDVKQKLFQALEQRIKPGAVLATNTSSLPIEEIAAPLQDPGRLIGIHFFNPVPQLPLVEVVAGAASREEEVRKGCAFVTAINKFPLIVKSGPGFLVNRVLAPYMMEAMARYEDGAQRELIDEAAKTFGMPMGPLELADQVGLDICKHVAEILKLDAGAGEGSRLDGMVASGKLGKKTGEGFYKWVDGKPQREKGDFDKEQLEVLGRELVQPLISECERCLAEGVVESADMVDAGVIFGTGFAPFRGGPLHYKASLGGADLAKAAE